MKKMVFYFWAAGLMILNSLGLQAQSGTKNDFPTVIINGRIQYDLEFLKMGTQLTTSTEFRRVHLSAAGNVSKTIKYKLELGLTRGKIGARDLYVQYAGGKLGNFYLGSKVEPTGLAMMTSSKYVPFFERPMVSTLNGFPWASGFHYNNYQLFNNRLALQFAYTFNGRHTDGFFKEGITDGGNIVARISGLVFHQPANHALVHLGMNFDNRIKEGAEDFQLKFRPENNTGEKIEVSFEEIGAVIHRRSFGLEAAANYKSISLQVEYESNRIISNNKVFVTTGYYAFVSYFLTGEHRPYKNGAFTRVKPRTSIDQKGPGAIEILVRYSVLDSSDSNSCTSFGELETNGRTKDITLGINWYLNPYARVMYNFVNTDFGFKQPNPNTNEFAHLVRFQVDF